MVAMANNYIRYFCCAGFCDINDSMVGLVHARVEEYKMKRIIIALILVWVAAFLIIAAGPVVAEQVIKIGFGYGG